MNLRVGYPYDLRCPSTEGLNHLSFSRRIKDRTLSKVKREIGK